jgi:hypothetical protein
MKSEMKSNIAAADVGLEGVTLAATRTSNFIGCEDASAITVLYAATRDAYTALHFEVDWYKTSQANAAPTAYESLGTAPAVSSGELVSALYPDKYTRTTSSSENKSFTIPCKARFMKLRVSATSGGASDLITVDLVRIKTA